MVVALRKSVIKKDRILQDNIYYLFLDLILEYSVKKLRYINAVENAFIKFIKKFLHIMLHFLLKRGILTMVSK